MKPLWTRDEERGQGAEPRP